MINEDSVDHFITTSETELLFEQWFQKCPLYSGNNSHSYISAYSSCFRAIMMIVSAVVFFFFFFFVMTGDSVQAELI